MPFSPFVLLSFLHSFAVLLLSCFILYFLAFVALLPVFLPLLHSYILLFSPSHSFHFLSPSIPSFPFIFYFLPFVALLPVPFLFSYRLPSFVYPSLSPLSTHFPIPSSPSHIFTPVSLFYLVLIPFLSFLLSRTLALSSILPFLPLIILRVGGDCNILLCLASSLPSLPSLPLVALAGAVTP